MTEKLYFAKEYDDAILPTKKDEDAGYDIYAYGYDEIELLPQDIKMVSTGIRTAFNSDYAMLVRERGSSGSKGLGVRAGVIDSGFRGEIRIVLNNTTNKTIILSKDVDETKKELSKGMTDPTYVDTNYIIYPLSKGIAQLVMVKIPQLEVEEMPKEDLLKIESERGEGMLGSSNK